MYSSTNRHTKECPPWICWRRAPTFTRTHSHTRVLTLTRTSVDVANALTLSRLRMFFTLSCWTREFCWQMRKISCCHVVWVYKRPYEDSGRNTCRFTGVHTMCKTNSPPPSGITPPPRTRTHRYKPGGYLEAWELSSRAGFPDRGQTLADTCRCLQQAQSAYHLPVVKTDWLNDHGANVAMEIDKCIKIRMTKSYASLQHTQICTCAKRAWNSSHHFCAFMLSCAHAHKKPFLQHIVVSRIQEHTSRQRRSRLRNRTIKWDVRIEPLAYTNNYCIVKHQQHFAERLSLKLWPLAAAIRSSP